MKVKREIEKMSKLEEKQAETINYLQEKIKLKHFDLIKLKEYNKALQKKIAFTNFIIKNVIKELEQFEDKKAKKIILMLKSTNKKGVIKDEK